MSLTAISPLDGRYHSQTAELGTYLSEFALIKYRVQVEVAWVQALAARPEIAEVRHVTEDESMLLHALVCGFDEAAAARVKEIEAVTRHDVKAVEYYLRERLRGTALEWLSEWVHFGCTSEDINNLAHALMLQAALTQVWLPAAREMCATVAGLARAEAARPMLARTHGQAATPTTLGKELAVFVTRWQRQLQAIAAQEYLGKFNGAVGNFNAHLAAYPQVPWEQIAADFVAGLGLTYNPLTTQIEPHDYLAECFHALIRFDNILLDFVRDVWTYISIGYFKQRVVAGEVGSSTMPHKVNPIDFENAEANLGMANAVFDHLANKLPISRLQRDLSDSSALRNMGVGVAHSLIALRSVARGLGKLSINAAAIDQDLQCNWEVLAEPIQTIMRKSGQAGAYEKLKDLTRGEAMTQESLSAFIGGLELPSADMQRLLALSPATYVGLAESLVRHIEPSA